MLRLCLLIALPFLATTACSSGGAVGDECHSDADCAEGLSCHLESEDDTAGEEEAEEHGFCTEHDHSGH